MNSSKYFTGLSSWLKRLSLDLKAIKIHLCINGDAFGINNILLTVNVATLLFISGRVSDILSAKEEKSGYVYNLVKS